MSARELNGWRTFYALDPFGEIRDNWHAALLATILTNAHRKPSSAPAKMHDFMYTDPQTARERQEREVLSWFEKHSEN